VTRCGFHAKCFYQGNNLAQCECLPGFSGNPYVRCFPNGPPPSIDNGVDCSCKQLVLSSTGPSISTNLLTFGTFFYYGNHNGLPVYQHQSGEFFLYHDTHEGVLKVTVGHVANNNQVFMVGDGGCPYKLNGTWYYYNDLKDDLEEDQHLQFVCNDFNSASPNSLSGNTIVQEKILECCT